MSLRPTRVLLLGASGLLGSHLLRRLPQSCGVVAAPGRGGAAEAAGVRWLPMTMDAADLDAIGPLLDAAAAEVVVNATGAAPRSDASVLARVNARFPRALADAAVARGSRVIQISTDGVFSGSRGHYSEEDRPDPVDDHGRSKLEGELAAPHLTIRTSFYGRSPRGTGLVEWLVSQRGGVIDGFADYRFTGIAAAILADFVALSIDRGLSGMYHVGGGPVTKFDLLCSASRRLNLNVTVRPLRPGAVDRTLDTARFFAAIGRRPPTVEDSIEALMPCDALSRS
jgi:dTDP-4-dehydrorhamnose reductase